MKNIEILNSKKNNYFLSIGGIGEIGGNNYLYSFKGEQVIVDAGIGTASDATTAMELGCEGVLVNSAIAHANKPILMAKAFKDAVVSGRNSYLAGRMKKNYFATASSPLKGLI